MQKMLEIQNVSKTFNAGTVNEKTALNGLNLKLNEGDFVTVIGGNGAGKSTMLNAVAGVWPVDSGKIIIDGTDVTKLGEHQRAAYIGRVFQDPMTGTAATMQIEENLALAARRGKRRGLRIGNLTEFYYFALSFFVYGFLGWCTEVAYAAVKQGKFVNRGFLNGPICPVYGIGVGVVVQFLTPVENNLVLLYISSTILVTAIEGITGFLLEKIFHNKWWDYSDQPLNIGGYVCVLFSLIWGVFCVLIVKVIHPLIYKVLTMIPFVLGIIVMACLAVGLLADLYVTASAILKMNRKLETMEKIAAELKDLSNKVGENIYENVMEGMEFQEEKKEQLGNVREELKERLEEPKAIVNGLRDGVKERLEEPKARMEKLAPKINVEEMKARMEELKAKYEEMAENRTKVGERLVKAFPKMQVRQHKEIFEELRERVRRSK